MVIYKYNPENHKSYFLNWFAGFKGAIHTDADFFEDLAGILMFRWVITMSIAGVNSNTEEAKIATLKNQNPCGKL